MNAMEPTYSKNPEICPNCYVGRISRQSKSLVTFHKGKPVTIPDFPVWVCDVCKAFVYDPQALAYTQTLLASKGHATARFPERKTTVSCRKTRKPAKPKTVDQK